MKEVKKIDRGTANIKGKKKHGGKRGFTRRDWTVLAVTCAIVVLSAVCCALFAFTGMGAASAVFLALAVFSLLSSVAAASLSRRYRFLRFALGMLFVVFMLQSSFNCAYPVDFDSGEQLAWYSVLVRVITGSFQMFTLDADYVTVVSLAGEVLAGAGEYVFIALFCVMSLVAPATGGFVIFSLLSRIFPRLRLMAQSFKRTKYIFSELNEYSIATAESIDRERRSCSRRSGMDSEGRKSLKSSVIIFTDAYIGDGSDVSNELLARAKNIGAICLKDDITELNLRWWFRSSRVKKAVYFLMDKQEENNLKDATAILSGDSTVNRWAKCGRGLFGLINNPQRARKLDLYVFTRSAAAYETIRNAYTELVGSNENNVICEVLKQVIDALSKGKIPQGKEPEDVGVKKTLNDLKALSEKYGGKLRLLFGELCPKVERETALACAQELLEKYEKHSLDINFKAINEYRNLVYHLISGYASDRRSEAGDGKTYPLYWGRPTWKDAEGGLEYDLKELTVAVFGGGSIGKEFIKAAYWAGQMMGRREQKGPDGKVTYSYYNTKLRIVVLGRKAQSVTAHELEFDMPEAFDPAYRDYCDFVFSEATFGTAEFEQRFKALCPNVDYVLVAFGDDELNFRAASWAKKTLDRIHMSDGRKIPINMVIENTELCEAINRGCSGKQDGCLLNAFGDIAYRYDIWNIKVTRAMRLAYIVDTAHGNKVDEKQFYLDEYSSGSSMASALHLPYKLTGMGMLHAYTPFSDKTCREIDTAGYDSAVQTEVYWIEHRRWCAYMRSEEGCRCPTAAEFLNMAFNEDGSFRRGRQKDMALRLHACLVESEKNLGVKAELNTEPVRKWRGKCPEEMMLAEWLDTCVEPIPAEGGSQVALDRLDKIRMLTGEDFKAYDLKVVEALLSDLKKESTLKDMSIYFPEEGKSDG